MWGAHRFKKEKDWIAKEINANWFKFNYYSFTVRSSNDRWKQKERKKEKKKWGEPLTVHCMGLRHWLKYHRLKRRPLDHHLWTILTNEDFHTTSHQLDIPMLPCDPVILIFLLYFVEKFWKKKRKIEKEIQWMKNWTNKGQTFLFFYHTSTILHAITENASTKFNNFLLFSLARMKSGNKTR